MNRNLKLGEPLEITASEKFIGYLFKIDKEQIVLCNSERFNPQGLIYIQSDAVQNVECLNPNYRMDVNNQPQEPQAVAQADGADVPVEKEAPKSNVLQFPGPRVKK